MTDITVEPAKAPERNPAQVYIQLGKADIRQVVGLEPGDQVKITLTGKLTTVSTREPEKAATSEYVGDITLEQDAVTIEKDEAGSLLNLMD